MLRSTACSLFILALAGCRATPTVATAAGHYLTAGRHTTGSSQRATSDSIVSGQLTMELVLFEDGSFAARSNESWGGSGVQVSHEQHQRFGRWEIIGKEIRFEAESESPHAFVTLDGATARFTDDGLRLRSKEGVHDFVRTEVAGYHVAFGPGLYPISGGGDSADSVHTNFLPSGQSDSMQSATSLVGDYIPVGRLDLTSLSLRSDGTYAAGFWAHSYDACLSVIGNGVSRGSWEAVNGGVRLAVERESGGLGLSLDGAILRRDGQDLLLAVDGSEHRLTPGRNFSTELSAN